MTAAHFRNPVEQPVLTAAQGRATRTPTMPELVHSHDWSISRSTHITPSLRTRPHTHATNELGPSLHGLSHPGLQLAPIAPWDRRNGTAYQLLQTEYDGHRDRLCLSEGLTSHGFINSLKVPL